MFVTLLFAIVLEAPPLGLDLYRPIPEENPLTKDKVALGRRLFFDKRCHGTGRWPAPLATIRSGHSRMVGWWLWALTDEPGPAMFPR